MDVWELKRTGETPLTKHISEAYQELISDEFDTKMVCGADIADDVFFNAKGIEYPSVCLMWYRADSPDRISVEPCGKIEPLLKVMDDIQRSPVWANRLQTLRAAITKAEALGHTQSPFLLAGLGMMKPAYGEDPPEPIVICWSRKEFSPDLALAVFSCYPQSGDKSWLATSTTESNK